MKKETKRDKKIYQKIVEEQPYCQLCGSTNWLEIHHIVYRSENGSNDDRNLIRLCKYHHQEVHSNKKKWQPFLIQMQQRRYKEYFTKEDVTKRKKYFKID